MQAFLDKFIDIGFSRKSSELSDMGSVRSYIYSSNYLKGNYYTLITYTMDISDVITKYTRYRLYLFSKNSTRAELIFQSSCETERQFEYLSDIFDQLFKLEIREKEINKILHS